MTEIDVGLALHCLSDVGSVSSPSCPILAERTLAMKDDVCDGLSITDSLFAFLVQALQEERTCEKKGERNRLLGQVEALSYSVALIENPYRPDVQGVLARATAEAFDG